MFVKLLFGGVLIFWSSMVIYFGRFWYGVEKKGGFEVNPETSPLGFWLTTGSVALAGMTVIIAAIFVFVRASKIKRSAP